MANEDVPEMYRGSQKQIDGYRYVAALSRHADDPSYQLPPPADHQPVAHRPAVKVGTIYFVGPEAGPIKIGFASRLEFRLNDLRLMNALPLIVHATVEGPPKLEREYHQRFSAHRLHGEWFAPHAEILFEIDRLSGENQPPAALFRRVGR